jgi:hypothetical protein
VKEEESEEPEAGINTLKTLKSWHSLGVSTLNKTI